MRLTFLLILALCLLGDIPRAIAADPAPPTAESLPSDAAEKIRAYLSSLPSVRVQMVASPGNGHQAAGLRMIQRLRELGFKGKVQLIYEDEPAKNAVGPKLKNLVSGFDDTVPGPQVIRTPELGEVEFVAKSASKELVKAEKMSLGLSAASDMRLNTGHNAHINVENFVQLQPRRWSLRASTREIIIGNEEPVSLQHLWNLGAAAKPPAIENWDAFLNQELGAPGRAAAHAEKLSGMRTLMNASEAAELLPAYAIDVENQADYVMSEVMEGLTRAMNKHPADFNRPVLVPIMTEWKTPAQREAFEKAMQALGHGVVDVKAAELNEKLASLKPRQVLFVQVGQLPPAVFDGVFTRATLPPLLAGRNLADLLGREGIPYLNVMGETKDFYKELMAPGVPDEARNAAIRAHAVFGRNQFKNPTFEKLNRESLADYYASAKRGAVKEFFAGMKANPSALEQDLVAMSLLELQKELAGRANGSIKPKVNLPPGALGAAPSCPQQFSRFRGPGRGYAP